MPLLRLSKAKLIKKVTALANCTTLSLSGLNLDPKKRYLIFYNLKNANPAGATQIHLYINNDTTITNYYRSELAQQYGAPFSSGYGNDPMVAWPQSTGHCEAGDWTIACDIDGRVRIFQRTNAWAATALWLEFKSLLYDVVVTSITQIDVVALVTNALGVGSSLALYALEN